MGILKGPLEVIGGLVVGIVWGFICAGFPHRKDTMMVAKRSAMIGLGGISFVLGSIVIDYQGAGPLAAITASLVASICWKLQGWDLKNPAGGNPVSNVYTSIWVIFQPILFGLIGSQIDVKEIKLDDVGNAFGIIVGGLVFRIAVCFLSLLGGSLNWREMLFVNFAWLPKATVQAALAPQPSDKASQSGDEYEKQIAQFLLVTAVLAIIITAPIGSISLSVSGPYLLSRSSKRSESVRF